MNDIFCTIIFTILTLTTVKGQTCPGPLKDCSRENIKFFLYTSTGNPPQELMLDNPSSISNVKFIEDADFKLLIHGYSQSKDSPNWVKVREEYFKEKKWNLLVVDYNPVAIWGCYFETLVPSVGKLGECIGTFLKLLFKEKPKITIDRFHFVGFSIGSQICAEVSNNLRTSGLTIPRITGCDPAFSGVTKDDKKKRNILNRDHADFVDTIHTNMGEAGVEYSHAHYDIYANNGTVQPGCDPTDPRCSHNRALKIFAETINSSVKMMAQKCDSKSQWVHDKVCTGDHHLKIEVGEHCKLIKTEESLGIYQFNTNPTEPFAIPPPC